MTHDWDAGIVLDVSYEGVASSRDDQIDVPVHGKEGGDVFPCMDGLNVCVWEGGCR